MNLNILKLKVKLFMQPMTEEQLESLLIKKVEPKTVDLNKEKMKELDRQITKSLSIIRRR